MLLPGSACSSAPCSRWPWLSTSVAERHNVTVQGLQGFGTTGSSLYSWVSHPGIQPTPDTKQCFQFTFRNPRLQRANSKHCFTPFYRGTWAPADFGICGSSGTNSLQILRNQDKPINHRGCSCAGPLPGALAAASAKIHCLEMDSVHKLLNTWK